MPPFVFGDIMNKVMIHAPSSSIRLLSRPPMQLSQLSDFHKRHFAHDDRVHNVHDGTKTFGLRTLFVEWRHRFGENDIAYAFACPTRAAIDLLLAASQRRRGWHGHRCASGCVVECRICNREVAGSNLSLGYFAPRSTQPPIPPGSVNEDQLQLRRKRQVWRIPIADERVGVQVKLWNPLRTRAIPECFCGGDSLRRGAISSVCTLPYLTYGRIWLRTIELDQAIHCQVWGFESECRRISTTWLRLVWLYRPALHTWMKRQVYSIVSQYHMQWRRSVVKYGGRVQSGQAIKLFIGRLEKLVFIFHFDTSLSSLQSYAAIVLNERMRHFMEVKTYSDPSYIFSGGQDPSNPKFYAPHHMHKITSKNMGVHRY